jgi:hypothetical protein
VLAVGREIAMQTTRKRSRIGQLVIAVDTRAPIAWTAATAMFGSVGRSGALTVFPFVDADHRRTGCEARAFTFDAFWVFVRSPW